jgi:hypothetical protein
MAYAPPEDPNSDQELTFVVKVHSFGTGDAQHISAIEAVLWRHLHRAFGADRAQVWHDGARVYFDPVDDERTAHD